MLFTKKTEYAVRCMVYLDLQKGKISNNKEISSGMNIPEYFLSKILQSLIKKNIVFSSRGMNGGYTLARSSDEINILEIIEAVQGPFKFSVCFLDEKNCEYKRKCVINQIWDRVNITLQNELKNLKISEFTSKAMDSGQDQCMLENCLGLPGTVCCQMRQLDKIDKN